MGFRTRAAAVAVAALTLGGVTACGAEQLEPKLALKNAGSQMGQDRTGAYTLSISSSAQDVNKFLSSNDELISPQTLDKLLTSKVRLGFDRGSNMDSPDDDSATVGVTVGGADAGEVLSTPEEVFLRVRMDELSKQFPQLSGEVEQGRRAMTDPQVPAELREPVMAVLEGKWVGMKVSDLEKIANEDPRGTEPKKDVLPKDAQEQVRKLIDDIRESDTTVKRVGSDDTGDHLQVAVRGRGAYTKLRATLPKLLPVEQSRDVMNEMPPATEVPDQEFTFDVWVKDDRMKRLEFDLASLTTEDDGHMTLRVDADGGSEIKRPDGGTMVDVAALMEAINAATPAGQGTRPLRGMEPSRAS